MAAAITSKFTGKAADATFSYVPDAPATFPEKEQEGERVEFCTDPVQALTSYRTLGVAGASLVLNVVLGICVIYLVAQKPRMVVIDRTGGGDRTMMVDDKLYGATGSMLLGPDRLTSQGKLYLVRNFLELNYGNDPARRPEQLAVAIGMIVGENGRKYLDYLNQNRVLEQETAESWQATWATQRIEMDESNPFVVRAIGTQRLRRVVDGTPRTETHQLSLTIPIIKDPEGRNDRNLHTGWMLDQFDWNELKTPATDNAPAPPTSAPALLVTLKNNEAATSVK